MFGSKNLEELKDLITSQDKKIQVLVSAVEKNRAMLSELDTDIKDKLDTIEDSQKSSIQDINKALTTVISLSTEFERSLSSFNNIKNRIDDVLVKKVSELTESELYNVKNKLKDFKGINSDFEALVSEINLLREQVMKFNNISENIKEVDFTLNKHAKDLELSDKRKLELEKENDMLKSLMAKMKRNDRRKRFN